MPERDGKASGRGRVRDLFSIRNRGTFVVVEITEGVWRSGSLLVCAKGQYCIRSTEFIDDKRLPEACIALGIDDDRVRQSVVIGEEVWTATQIYPTSRA